jgi:hypothetical protein
LDQECPQLNLDLAWEPVRDASGAVVTFPLRRESRISQETYGKPVVYRWKVRRLSEAEPFRVYIGETDSLFRRIRNYRNAHPSQKQTYRIACQLRDDAANGAVVELEVLSFPIFFVNGEMIEPSALSDPNKRKLMENFALVVQDRINCEVSNISLKRFDRRIRQTEAAELA